MGPWTLGTRSAGLSQKIARAAQRCLAPERTSRRTNLVGPAYEGLARAPSALFDDNNCRAISYVTRGVVSPGREIVELVVGMPVDGLCDQVDEVGVGFDAVEPAGFDQ